MTTNEKVIKFKELIEAGAIAYGLNLAIYDGKLAFVDQKEKKIVALWTPGHNIDEK